MIPISLSSVRATIRATLTFLLGASIFGALTVPMRAEAQLADALRAQRANEFLRLELLNPSSEKPAFVYTIDSRNPSYQRPLGSDLAVAVVQQKGLNVQLGFLNPVLYSWRTSESSVDDPTYAALKKFVAAAGDLFGSVGVPGATEAVKPPGPINPNGAHGATSANTPASVHIRVPTFSAPVLLQWEQWIDYRLSCFTDATRLITALNDVGAADRHLYNTSPTTITPGTITTAGGFRAALTDAFTPLKRAANMRALREAVASTSSALTQLSQTNTDAANALAKGNGSDVLALVKDDGEMGACAPFRAFTKNAFVDFKAGGDKLLASRKRVVNDLDALQTRVGELLPSNLAIDYFPLGTIALPGGVMKDVTVTVHRQEVSLDGDAIIAVDKADTKATFRVREYESVAFEYTVGMALSMLRFPRYTTNVVDGKTVVAQDPDDIQRALPMATLNMVPNSGITGRIYPMLQIGIGASKDYPAFAVGGGLRILGNAQLALAFGAVFRFQRELNTLKLGGPVADGAALDKDLTTRFKTNDPKFYVGVQRAF